MHSWPDIMWISCVKKGQTVEKSCRTDRPVWKIYRLAFRLPMVRWSDTGVRRAMDMSRIPFPYKHMDIKDLEHRIIYYESSRGCPFSCSYCLSSIDKSVRFRSLELVLDELAYFLEAGVLR